MYHVLFETSLSMLANTLNTNEIKNAAGTEVEFSRLSQGERTTVFAKIGETPSAPLRLGIKHSETGEGIDTRRRSLVRLDLTVTGQVDATRSEVCSFYIVGDIPVGNLTSNAEPKNALAMLLSFCATTGAATTVLFDCTGNGASVLIDGGL